MQPTIEYASTLWASYNTQDIIKIKYSKESYLFYTKSRDCETFYQ